MEVPLKEAATLCKKSEKTLRRKIDAGLLGGRKEPLEFGGFMWMIDVESLDLARSTGDAGPCAVGRTSPIKDAVFGGCDEQIRFLPFDLDDRRGVLDPAPGASAIGAHPDLGLFVGGNKVVGVVGVGGKVAGSEFAEVNPFCRWCA